MQTTLALHGCSGVITLTFNSYLRRYLEISQFHANTADVLWNEEVDRLFLRGFKNKTEVDTQMDGKQSKPTDPNDSFALVSDIPGLSGGYTTSQIDGFLAEKVDSEDVYTKTESDNNYLGSVSIGSVSTLPAYDLNAGVPNQASVVNTGTGNNVILDFQIPQGFTGSVGAKLVSDIRAVSYTHLRAHET